MANEKQYKDSHEPEKFVSKDVSDLKIEFGQMQANIEHLKNDAVTKAELADWKVEFANWKLGTVKWVVQLAIPVIAVLLGYLFNSRHS